MPIKVEHRPDRPLERAVNKECPDDLKDTLVGQVTWPVHRAAHTFLEEQVVGKDFADKGKLQEVLDTWPDFAEDHEVTRLGKDFATLTVVGEVITFPQRGPGGGLQIAIVQAAA